MRKREQKRDTRCDKEIHRERETQRETEIKRQKEIQRQFTIMNNFISAEPTEVSISGEKNINAVL